MRFSEVIGQQEAKERLLQMVSEDRLPYAISPDNYYEIQ